VLKTVEPDVVDCEVKARIAQEAHHSPDMIGVDVRDHQEIKMPIGQAFESGAKPRRRGRGAAIDQNMVRFVTGAAREKQAIALFGGKDF
jgi:hypothetical protein